MMDAAFLEMLRCPVCRGRLDELSDPHRLKCQDCRRSYRVNDGIPALAPDLAEEE